LNTFISLLALGRHTEPTTKAGKTQWQMKMAVEGEMGKGENAACNVHLICCCNNNAAAIFHSFQWGRFLFGLYCSFYANFAT